jgi:hypothetical protein
MGTSQLEAKLPALTRVVARWLFSNQSELYAFLNIPPIPSRQSTDDAHIPLEQRDQIQSKTGRRMQSCRPPILDFTIRRAERIRWSSGDQAENNVRTMMLVKLCG